MQHLWPSQHATFGLRVRPLTLKANFHTFCGGGGCRNDDGAWTTAQTAASHGRGACPPCPQWATPRSSRSSLAGTVVHRFVVGGEVVAECCQLLAELGSRGLRHSAAFALKERQGLKGVPGDRGATSSENWASRLGPQGNERGAVEGRQPHVASNTPQGFLSSLGGLLRNTMMYQLHDTAAESTHRAFARDTPSCSREQTNVM